MKLTFWFNLLGWPENIRTDSGPQFRSEFDDFGENFYILHELSSPYHPDSNGLAEAAVKNAKSLLKKCEITGQIFQRCFQKQATQQDTYIEYASTRSPRLTTPATMPPPTMFSHINESPETVGLLPTGYPSHLHNNALVPQGEDSSDFSAD